MKKSPTSDAAGVELDREIARYEAMSDEEVDAELALYGINPQPTIDAVTALVKVRLMRDRGLLHQKAVLAISIAVAITGAKRLQQIRRGARV